MPGTLIKSLRSEQWAIVAAGRNRAWSSASRASRPLHYRWHRRQDRGNIPAGFESKNGAAVVEQVELNVAAATDELLFPVGFGPRGREVGAYEAGVDVEEGCADLLGKGEAGVKVACAGVPATVGQIEEFFTRNGWRRFMVNGDVAFLDPVRRVAISDTHQGNLILMDDGLLAPIDLRVQPLSGALLDAVVRMCEV